jgi:hypothetical protein
VSEIPRVSVPATDPTAADRIAEVLAPVQPALVVLFASSTANLETIAAGLAGRLPKARVVGCSTAGELGPGGMAVNTVVAVGLPGEDFRVSSRLIDLTDPTLAQLAAAAEGAIADLAATGVTPHRDSVFALLFADGLAGREELLASAIHDALGGIPLCGGSAGDAMTFTRTFVVHGREVRTQAAVLTLVHTRRPFHVFKTQHFLPGTEKLVVTGADAESRTVHEINGEPAAEEYARAVGVPVSSLGPPVFADHPVVVKIGADAFVRALARVNADASLTFMCAIEEGVVLTVATSVDLVANLRGAMRMVKELVGEPALILGCDCVLRRLEIERRGITPAVNEVLADLPVLGFSTYGEQLNSTHVNQTLTGVAIGASTVHA